MGIISGSGSFRGRFGDHFRVGDHFGVGIISGAVQLSPTLKSFMFARARSDCPDFLFEILIEEGQRIVSMLMSTRYRAYQDAF